MQTRRTLIKTAALGTGAVALSSCERSISVITQAFGQSVPEHLAVAQSTQIDPEFHLLSRAAFGPWPGDLERAKEMGRQAWIEEQLEPTLINDELCDLRARRFESLFFSAGDAYEFKKPVLRDELTRHSLLRAIYSRRQLFEVMVEFWTDHLNIDLEKGDCIYLKPSDDRDVIRKHALGNFHDLIRASASSPAMLVYLDGKSNKVRKGTQDKPNENYARELMELHTLGVHGGYTQTDVREAARCLSGWTFDMKRKFALRRGDSFFKADWHDDGAKTVLGQTIAAGGGGKDLDRLVEIVCWHPSTAKFVAYKLCVRFISQSPTPSIMDRVAAEFTRTGGDIKSVLRVILNSEEFMASRGELLKRPFRFMVAALRAMAADTHVHGSPFRHGAGQLTEYLARMGHGLFQYPTPDGYPDHEAPWMGTLMWRWNFAMALADGKLGGVQVPMTELEKAVGQKGSRDEVASRWWAHLTGRLPTAEELSVLAEATDQHATKGDAKTARAELLGVMLASPACQRC
ncbi:MAG: hypothetical protein JWO89_3612 [Verrucomicrobiaceae bacterium]|nr:hypothetical protein [Verrucomicrobiaceae bacterium]